MSLAIIMGILSGITICLDMCKERKRRYFTKIFFSVYSVSTVSYSIFNNNNLVSKYAAVFKNLPAFSWSFGLTIVLVFTVLRLTFYQQWKKALKNVTKYPLSFFDFVMKGYDQFKVDCEKLLKNNNAISISPEPKSSFAEDYTEIIILASQMDSDADGYYGYMFYSLLPLYFKEGEASFTIRQYNKDTNSMDSKFSTRKSETPGSIPLSNKTLIQKSLDSGNRPVTYSLNKELHYRTKNGGIERGVYDDYVTLCLVSVGDRPEYSLDLEVKGQRAVRQMHKLVISNMLYIVGLAISLKLSTLKSDIESQTTFNQSIPKRGKI